LKKFKALFDASDPVQASEEGIDNCDKAIQASNGLINRNGRKRKHDMDNGAEVEMNDDEEEPDPEPRTKRQTTGSIAVEPIQPILPDFDAELVPKPETVLAKPDLDEDFLDAVAANKKRDEGKKDSCDREFKNLRISQLDVREETREQDWAVLEKFGDDRNIRGNFMVVMEIDVFKTDVTSKGVDAPKVNPEADFKKFKKVCHIPHIRHNDSQPRSEEYISYAISC
jgi:hypothetical protein